MRTSDCRYALLVLVLSAQALAASAPPSDTWDSAYVQPDVLRVRASASADATVLTRLPINHSVLVLDGPPSAEGYVKVQVQNQEVGSNGGVMLTGFVRADLLGERQTAELLERQLASARTPEEEWTGLERLVALRGSEDDKERLLALAGTSGNREWLAKAKLLMEPPPVVIGICFQGRVSILAERVGHTLKPLVEQVNEAAEDSPEVRAAEARLRARALELTTLRFSWYGHGAVSTGHLVQPRVVTERDVLQTARSRIELGPCPKIWGEVTAVNAHVFVSAPLVREMADTLSSAELVQYLARIPLPVNGLQVFTPPGRLIELNIGGAVYLFQKRKPEVWACSTDQCPSRRLTSTFVPVWVRLASGQQLRIGSLTEDVENSGWGSPANEGLWVHPDFALQLFDDKGGFVEALVSLNQYGC